MNWRENNYLISFYEQRILQFQILNLKISPTLLVSFNTIHSKLMAKKKKFSFWKENHLRNENVIRKENENWNINSNKYLLWLTQCHLLNNVSISESSQLPRVCKHPCFVSKEIKMKKLRNIYHIQDSRHYCRIWPQYITVLYMIKIVKMCTFLK